MEPQTYTRCFELEHLRDDVITTSLSAIAGLKAKADEFTYLPQWEIAVDKLKAHCLNHGCESVEDLSRRQVR